jgi:hypothetical protein
VIVIGGSLLLYRVPHGGEISRDGAPQRRGLILLQ